MSNLLTVRNLKVWDDRDQEIIVRDVSFSVPEHSCLAIVGESGSGKSMTVKAISSIHKAWIRCSGEVLFKDQDILLTKEREMTGPRGKSIFMIFQDGMSAFDPSGTIGATMREILCANLPLSPKQAEEAAVTAMKKVLLREPEELLRKYPHQLSGGMLQRIMIALALALEPSLIIADEPTTALDTITQYEVIEEFIRLRRETGTAMIFISHDLGIVRKIADYVVVMKDGQFVEEGPAEEIFCHPREEYTRFLVGTRRLLGENYRRLLYGQANAEGGL